MSQLLKCDESPNSASVNLQPDKQASDDGDEAINIPPRQRQRPITKAGQEVVEYVNELYSSGAKMWTKEMFRNIEEELAQEPKPSQIMVRSMNGELCPIYLPPFHIERPKVTVSFYHFQNVIDGAEEASEAELSREEKNWRTSYSSTIAIGCSKYHYPSLGYDTVKAAWEESRHNWTRSPVYTELTDILAKSEMLPKITKKIVCFGLGSLEGWASHSVLDDIAESDGRPLRRAMTQHAAALTVAKILGERAGTDPLPVLAQDPWYSPVAKRILTEAGIQVIDGHGALAFTHVDEHSLVFSCHPDIPVRQIVADMARPAAMIWDSERPLTDEKKEWRFEVINGEETYIAPYATDEESPRTRELVRGYDKYEFSINAERFGALDICVRRK